MLLRVLGPLDISHGHETIPLGGRRQQTILAMLALKTGQVTPTSQLIEAVWHEDPPPTSRAQVQTAVSALRKVFTRAGHLGVIHTEGPGYKLALDARMVDSLRFADLAAAAEQHVRAGRVSKARNTLRTALALRRGPTLLGIESELVRRTAIVLDERWLETVEECAQLELRLGLHKDLTVDLPPLIAEHPFRERLYGHLMLALYRCGRRFEALSVFRKARATLLEEMGVEPGPALHRLEQAILHQSSELDLSWQENEPFTPGEVNPGPGPSGQITPRQLPPSITDFTGRSQQIEQIEQICRTAYSDSTHATPIAVVSGLGGIGKSALAIRAAHMLSSHFPDGILYADLQSSGAQDCYGQLGGFLRSLGFPQHVIPRELSERAALFRSCLATKGVLVILDGVSLAKEILHLLPGSSRCMAIMVSRNRLPDIPGAQHVDVPFLSTEESCVLLERMIGAERAALERHSVTELAILCDGFPLALRIMGAKLNSHAHRPIGRIVERLRDEHSRLDGLRHHTWGLRPVLESAYAGLSEQEQKLFRLLALPSISGISARIAAALMETDPLTVEELLEGLRNASLLEVAYDPLTGDDSYRLRRLIQIYAHERLTATETPEERDTATCRALSTLPSRTGTKIG